MIVGDTGWVVPRKDPDALASAVLEAMSERESNPEAWKARMSACRQRIVDNFSLSKMISGYHQVWFDKA
ncbi:glycosyltransferase [Vibrio variabilis]|uniref:glycosyltransferase n=1 Tax=Vibrio variabilis TaxID=990271 RepID=UPI001EFA0965|nr:hypothetical protein [Vibrio variabilis]